MPKVALIMGSKSDWPSLTGCVSVLKGFGIEVEVHVASAHRTPEKVARFARDARANGFEVIIAAAGKAAHLAGVIAGHTTLPVIGIPIKSSLMDGLDSLLSTVQMPTGIPVATVAVGGGDNAAYLAAQMLSIKYPELGERLDAHRRQMAAAIEADDEALNAQL
ncbi:MAG: 5-(carboxyamino)imidazole ribonucleotide mutase [Candidatus Ventricola sp.]